MNNNVLYESYINFIKISKKYDDDYFLDNKQEPKEKYQIIGLYDTSNKIWYYGWTIFNNDKKNYYRYNKSKELIKYALDIERDLPVSINEKQIIRSILINSKINIIDDLQLQIIIALATYILRAKEIIEHIDKNYIYIYASF
jgi:hypothetical protein